MFSPSISPIDGENIWMWSKMLDGSFPSRKGARVQAAPPQESSTRLPVILMVFGISLFSAMIVHAATPFNSATVTRVENKVSYGQVHGEKAQTRPANPQDVVKASDFLLSQIDSRAELRYEDGTIVRIGQNTIFSFDAKTRTLKLEKGTFVFQIPTGMGGGTIKTPSFTAAMTGCAGKVSNNTFLMIEGTAQVFIPSAAAHGQKQPITLGPNQFITVNPDGSYSPDPAPGTVPSEHLFDGKLMTFNGDLIARVVDLPLPPPGASFLIGSTSLDATSGASTYDAIKQKTVVFVPPPKKGSPPPSGGAPPPAGVSEEPAPTYTY